MHFCIFPEFDFSKIWKFTFILCLSTFFGLILNVFYMGLIFSTLSGLIIGTMDDNKERLRQYVSIHVFARKKLDPRDHWFVPVYLMRKRKLLIFRCLRLRLPGGRCHLLLHHKPHQSRLMHLLPMLLFLKNLDGSIWHFITASVCKPYCYVRVRQWGKNYLYLFFETHVLYSLSFFLSVIFVKILCFFLIVVLCCLFNCRF